MAVGYYNTGVRTVSLTAAAGFADLRAGASTRLRVTEIGVSLGVAGASPTLGLVRETALGTASTSVVAQAEDPTDGASSATVGTIWSTAPTYGAVYMRRVTLPATIGAGWVWSWSEQNPLIVPVSTGLAIFLIGLSATTATALDVYFKHLE
jgi:hypothetical protein